MIEHIETVLDAEFTDLTALEEVKVAAKAEAFERDERFQPLRDEPGSWKNTGSWQKSSQRRPLKKPEPLAGAILDILIGVLIQPGEIDSNLIGNKCC